MVITLFLSLALADLPPSIPPSQDNHNPCIPTLVHRHMLCEEPSISYKFVLRRSVVVVDKSRFGK